MISSPQYHVYAPETVRIETPLLLPPSIVARSPGIARTTTGAVDEPVRYEVNVPRYVPPFTQIVSPP